MRTDETVVANLDDLPCRRERREGVLVRALVAQSTIEPKAGEANLPTNHFGSDIAAASGRISVVSLSSFRVYRRFLRSLRSDQWTWGQWTLEYKAGPWELALGSMISVTIL